MAEKIDVPNNLEQRILAVDDIELRIADGDKPKIIGYAAKYNKRSVDMGGFTESIEIGAFDEVIKNNDIRALKNHDPNLLLGRTSNGTLKLSSDAIGLRFEITPPNTTTAKDTVEEIRQGLITGCSFSFIIGRNGKDEWSHDANDNIHRTIKKFGTVIDLGPVSFPAYPDTTVAARSLDNFKKTIKEEKNSKEQPKTEAELKKIKEQERLEQREIKRKYDLAGRIINRNQKSAEV